MKGKVCVFPGSFNPFTLGHLDVVKGALERFDNIIIAVAEITYKADAPSAEIRAEIAEKSLDGLHGTSVECFGGMLTDYLAAKGCDYIVRGIRDEKDKAYEKDLLDFYRKSDERIDALYIGASHPYISSAAVRELIRTAPEELKKYVTANIIADIIKIYAK